MADSDIRPGPVPAEVLRYFRQKGLKVGFSYADVWNEEHDFAFTAAKIMRRDVLDTLHDEVTKAIEQGLPYREFVKSVEPRMKALGWWEPHEVIDPKTGKSATVNPPARLRTIFATNMRTARAVGQWDRIQRTKKTRPYLLYQVGPSARHREQHLAWHGLLLPADDPFWNVAFPPNGYNCFPAGTPVLTPSGWTPIESVSRGTVVVNGAGQPHVASGTHAKAFDGHLVRLTGKWGSTRATPNHRFLTHRGWVKAANLKPGDVLVQLPEVPVFDPQVRQVDEPYSTPADFLMSLPGQVPVRSDALDPETQREEIDVDPVPAHVMVVEGFEPSFAEVIENELFAWGRLCLGIDVGAWIFRVSPNLGESHLEPDLWTPGRARNTEALAHLANRLAVLLGQAEAWVSSSLYEGLHALAGQSPLFSPPVVACLPLAAYRLGTRDPEPEMLDQAHHSALIDLPPASKPLDGEFPIDVEEPEGLVSGAPLHFFDSLDSFVTWSRLHCTLHMVESVSTTPYTGSVYNLSVEGESYVVPGAIVHNCKCSVRSVSQREADSLEKDGVLAPNPEPVLDDQGNPTGHVVEKRVPVIRVAPELPIVPWVNHRTGNVEYAPEGIHPSFARTPGEARIRSLQGV